jgi:nitronate monooxygenase
MTMWPDRRILDLLHIDVPILLAPMAGPGLAELAIAVAEAGGLGSLPTALLGADQVRAEVAKFRAGTSHSGRSARPINLNFFCHTPPVPDPARDAAWRDRLVPFYRELGIDPATPIKPSARAPFDDALCQLVEELRPEVVSFHFGLPEPALLDRVRAAGAVILASATTVAEARWLEGHGCVALIAQGAEAGGHRGTFLSEPIAACASQPGTMALVPQIVDAVSRPVIAAGGIADGRGIVAALALGASAVQIGTAYLFCPEAKVSAAHRDALRRATDDGTAMTNLFTGRPARSVVNRAMREIGPLSADAPAFPLAGGALAPLKARAEGDWGSLWAGQAAGLGRERPAAELTRALAQDALARLGRRG